MAVRGAWFFKRCIGLMIFMHKSTGAAFMTSNHCPKRNKSRLCPHASNNCYLATCIPGLAPVLAEELNDLGASSVECKGNSAVTFTNAQDEFVGYKALLWLRTAHRLMQHVSNGQNVETRDDLYDSIREGVNVKDLLGDGQGGLLTLSVKVIANGRNLPKDVSHSHYTALTIKNALCDAVRDLRGDRPNVNLEHADVPLVCILHSTNDGRADFGLWKCLHNGSLHKRGYRSKGAIHKAAMKESLGAGLLMSAGFHNALLLKHQEKSPLKIVDPMCGSGSLIIEAAMMAADIAPGIMRIKCLGQDAARPPVTRWKCANVNVWQDLVRNATKRAKEGMARIPSSVKLECNDIHGGSLDVMEQNLAQAGFAGLVKIREGDCRTFKFEGQPSSTWVVTNPPWGIRLSEQEHEAWESLRIFLRQNCPPGTQAWVLSGNKEATKHLGLKKSRSVVVRTANQDLRWIQYYIRDQSSVYKEKEPRRQGSTRKKRIKAQRTRVETATSASKVDKYDSWY